jgi:hypothetical protein
MITNKSLLMRFVCTEDLKKTTPLKLIWEAVPGRIEIKSNNYFRNKSEFLPRPESGMKAKQNSDRGYENKTPKPRKEETEYT